MLNVNSFIKQYQYFNEDFSKINIKYEKGEITRNQALIKYQILIEEVECFENCYFLNVKLLESFKSELNLIAEFKTRIKNQIDTIKYYYQHMEL